MKYNFCAVMIGYNLLSSLTSMSPFQIFKACNSLIKWSKTHNVGIYFLIWIVRNNLVIELLGFVEIFIFLSPAPVVSVLEAMHIT